MCGIAGVINLNNKPVDQNQIKFMLKKIKHRGPDDEGIYCKNNFGFGHVRLSIQDLSKAGHQPMYSNDKRYCNIFNGEIYNFIELKNELNHYYEFKTKTDTEVILAAYQKWGEACLEKFNGDWAFVIYDSLKNEFFGARDRYGIKPFYYFIDDDQYMFASEIKAIIPLIKEKSQNHRAIYDYLVYNRTDQTEATFFNKIFKLKHGYYFKITDNQYSLYKWYNLKEKLTPVSLSFDQYREEIKSAISIRLRSDVPVGVSLSGGIDSSAVTSIVYNDLNLKGIKTFSAVYGKDEWADESNYIDEYNNELQNMYFTTPSANSFFTDFTKFIFAQGEPVASIGPYAQFKVMELAHGNVVVTLDGQGADEQLAGYHYFFGSYFKELIKNFKFTTLSCELWHYINKHRSSYAFKYLSFYLLSNNLKSKIGRKIYGNINHEFADVWGGDSTIGNDLYDPDTLNDSLLQHFEFKLEHLLKWDDLNAMNFSIESRVPFLDHNLVEKTLSLPPEMKINSAETKYILRESVKDILPNKIYKRRDKKGFSTPANKWFRSNNFKEYIFDMLESKSFSDMGYFDVNKCRKNFNDHLIGKTDITKDIWKWINLNVWSDEFINC